MISYDDEEELARQITVSNLSGPSTSKWHEQNRVFRGWFLSHEQGKEKDA